jgi:glucose dehydrogenase
MRRRIDFLLLRGGVFLLLTVVAAFTCSAQTNVTTYHNDNSRSGLNANETQLTPSNVNSTQFGKLFSAAVDGYVYAQPLYLPNMSIPNKGIHNVVYVATEHDSVYAVDADNGAVLWRVNFLNPAAGISTVSPSDISCSEVGPEVGITATPVIDPAAGTIYVVARTKESGAFVQRLHALDVTSGVERTGSPVPITASVSGTGDGTTGTKISFNALTENNRAGLLTDTS